MRSLRYVSHSNGGLSCRIFWSWIILSSVVLNLFSLNGVVNKVLGVLNVEPVIWFGESAYFRQLVVFTDVWKEFGFNAVIFMAALASVDPTYYEAAAIDGCSKWRSIFKITLPCIASTVVVVGVFTP